MKKWWVGFIIIMLISLSSACSTDEESWDKSSMIEGSSIEDVSKIEETSEISQEESKAVEESSVIELPPEGDFLLDDKFRTDEFLSEYDMQNQYTRFRAACETEEVYYFVSDNGLSFICYYDKVSGISGILCGKPECAHDNKDCNAHIIGRRGICCYEGKLYWTDSEGLVKYLYSMNLDGTDRKAEQVIKSDTAGLNPMVRLHRGYVYAATFENVVKDGEAIEVLKVQQEKIGASSTEEPVILYKEEFDKGRDYFMQIVANTMYLLINEYDVDTKESKVLLHAIDLATRQHTLLAEKEYQSLFVSDFYYADQLYIVLYDPWEMNPIELIKYTEGAEEFEVVCTLEIDSLSVFVQEDTLVGIRGGKSPAYCILDFEGNIIKEGKIPFSDGTVQVGIQHMGGTADYTLVLLAEHEAGREEEALIKISFDPADEIQILWKKE